MVPLLQALSGRTAAKPASRVAALGRGNGARVTMSDAPPPPPKKVDKWAALDPRNDTSDDQQDITRGQGMVDSLFQGWKGQGMATQARSHPLPRCAAAARRDGTIRACLRGVPRTRARTRARAPPAARRQAAPHARRDATRGRQRADGRLPGSFAACHRML
jgi:hypothetical protein